MYMEDDDEGDSGEEFITVNKSKHRRRRKTDGSNEKLAKKEAIDVETSQHCSNQNKTNTLNQVPTLKSKTKSKKQKAEQRRRDKADIDKKRPEEECANNTSAEKRPKEKEAKKKAKEEEKSEKQKKSVAVAAPATKQKSVSPEQPCVPSPSSSPRSFPVRELPPRFAHKKMATPQGPKKTGDARIGHWTGWEPHNNTDHNMDTYNSLGWSQQSIAASLKANQFWSGPDMVSHSHGDGREIGTWHNPEGAWGSNPQPSSNDIIVDTQDREAWPSIGDNSESASDAGDTDNASVKSGSVISNSSNAGQGSGNLSDSSGQGANTLKNQTSSSVWGSSYAGESSSHGPWASSPASNAGGWGTTGPVGDGFASAIQSSGAQNSGPQMTSTQPLSSVAKGMSWQGMGSSVSGFQKEQAATDRSSWSDLTGSSVIASGINVSSAGSNPNMDQWRSGEGNGNGAGAGGLGWGEVSIPPPAAAKPEPTGWGSPAGSPVPNAGTDAWGAPNKSVPQQWGNQAMPPVSSTGWGAPESKSPPASAGWGEQSEIKPGGSWAVDANRPPSRGWATPDNNKPSSPSVWGSSDTEQRSVTAAASSTQWGVGAANPQSQWGAADSAAAAGPPQAAPANPSSGQAWAASPPKQEPQRPPQQPTPQQAQQQQQQQQPPQQYPSTWAQAAGKGLVPAPKSEVLTEEQKREQFIVAAINSSDGWGKRPVRQDTTWEVEEPRQPPPPPVRRNSGSEQDGSLWNQNNNGTAIWESSKNSSGWTSARTGASSSGSSGSGVSDWGGSDNDGGHWNGPPGSNNGSNNSSNTWNGPPNSSNQWGGQWNEPKPENNPSNMWGGGGGGGGNGGNMGPGPKAWNGGSSGSGGSSHSGGKEEQQQWGGSPKEDNVWDRNGTSAWGNNGGGPGNGGGKTEIGTWVDPNRQRRNSNSNEWSETGGWDGAAGGKNPSPIDNGTAFWGDPQGHPKGPNNWSSPNTPSGAMPQHLPQRSLSQGEGLDKGSPYWNQTQPPSKSSGWGDPMGPSGTKVEDGASLWGQMQNKGWEQGQWSSGAKPKTSSTWGDTNDWNQQKKGAIYPNSGNRQNPPQMRSKLLQQLVEMGFKREDAQNALISNNMNLESAIADLIQGATKRTDFDMEEKARRVRGMGLDSLPPDSQADPSQLVPPMTNTPFSTAQNSMPNPQMMLNIKGTSLQNMSSLNNFSNASINPSLQQKLLLQQQNLSQGQAIRGQLAPQAVQQQLMQQQIMQQLRMAVQAGLISPQLLNQQLTPTLRIMVQQLLQLQETSNRLIANQQMLQQQLSQPASKPNPLAQRQLDQLLITIPKVRQQIFTIQQQIAQAQQQPLAKTPRGLPVDPKELTEKLSGLSMAPKDNMHPMMVPPQQVHPPQQPPVPAAQQAQSRLTQWKLPSPEKDGDQALNKAPGSKPLTQSHSNPNLTADIKTSTSSLLYDSTWSSSANNATNTNPSWPTSADAKDNQSSNKESRTTPSPGDNGTNPVSSSMAPASSSSPAVTTTASTSSEDSSHLINDIGIPEFVPGKPWTGLSTKSVEDDPYITPGSVTRPSLSVNTIKDDYVMTTLGKPSSPSVTETASPSSTSWSSLGQLSKNKSTWSSSSSLADSGSLASELWGVRRPPPGLTNQPKVAGSSWQQGSGFNRSMSWAGGDRSGFPDPGWGGQTSSSYLLLKNLPPQIDSSTLRALCTQHGPLLAFYPNLQYGHALVRYSSKEEAQKAQRALNACMLGNMSIMAEFMSDADAARLMEQSQPQAPSTPSMWSQATNPGPAQYGYRTPSSAPALYKNDANHWNMGSGPWSGGGLWAIDDLSNDNILN